MKRIPPAFLSALITYGLTAAVVAATATAVLRFGHTYGYVLFSGVPLVAGATSTMLYGRQARLTLSAVFVVTSPVALFASLGLLVLGTDGIVCILMSLPISLPMAWLGGFIVYGLNKAGFIGRSGGAAVALFPPLWAALLLESLVAPVPGVRVVISTVEVHADAETVWKNVVAFPPITEPLAPIFRLGIAYPMSATISGNGVGAIRRCNFSTGTFVEPITSWVPGRELEFSVIESPPPLRETSFYSNLDVPHLHGTFAAERGRFLITPTGRGTVMLEGTTWYRQRLWPQFYWDSISDGMVHRIHERVLQHIKHTAQSPVRLQPIDGLNTGS